MWFVIDGSEWDFESWESTDVADVLERLLDRMDVASERGEVVGYGEDLFSNYVLNFAHNSTR